MRNRFALLPLAVVLAAPAVARTQDHQHADELGNVTFPTSCNAEAQSRMNRAVAMLHSFWFPEARKTFESVLAADASCGIAHWGQYVFNSPEMRRWHHANDPRAYGSGALPVGIFQFNAPRCSSRGMKARTNPTWSRGRR